MEGVGGYPDHSIFGRKPKLLLQLMTDNCITPSTAATPIRAQHEFLSLNALKCSNTKIQRKIYLVPINSSALAHFDFDYKSLYRDLI